MRGGASSKKTDWFDLSEARLQLKSYSQPMMEMAVASSRSPTGALSAGKHGIGMLSIGGTSDDALKAHASNWGVYEEAARANGRTPDRRKWRIVTFAHVAETTEQARREVKFGLDDFGAISPRSRPSRSSRPTSRATPRTTWWSRAFAASARPETACAISNGCGRAPTAASAGCCCSPNWADWSATKKSYELMARYVHPHFQRNANELRDWSYDDAKAKFATAGMQSQAACRRPSTSIRRARADAVSSRPSASARESRGPRATDISLREIPG